MSDHEWCRDVRRDEAVRAAEDAAAVPEIQHRDLPEQVALLWASLGDIIGRVVRLEGEMDAGQDEEAAPAVCDSVPPANGLRTERVTPPWQRAKWDEAFAIICDGGDWGRGNNFDHGVLGALVIWADKEMDRLAAERDAALRERDAAQSQCEELERAALVDHQTIGTLRARVAELEAAAATAGTAGGDDAVVVPQTVVAGNFAQIHWNTCCRLHRMAMDKAGVRWTQSTEPSRPESEEAGNAGGEQEPPRGWLTAEEREALQWFCGGMCATSPEQAGQWRTAIQSLLARETPPMVRRPEYQNHSRARDCQWIAAIRAAGGEVE